MAQVTYGNLRITYSSLPELANKISRFKANETGLQHKDYTDSDIPELVAKAVVRSYAERVSASKRAKAEGKEPRVRTYQDL